MRKPQRGARPRPSAHPWAFFYIVRRLRNAERFKLMSVCFCIDNSTLSRNISNGSRNNPADVHRTSRTSLQFHYNNRHNVPHPTPKHTDKVNTAPHTTTQELLKKSPRGVQRGRGFAAPLRFSYFRKKILRPFANPNETQYFSKVFFYILLLNNTHSVHALDLLKFI